MPVNFQAYMQGRGSDLTGLVSTAAGPVHVWSSGKGYAKSEMLEYIYGQDFLSSLQKTVQDMFRSSKKKKNDEMKIDCAAFNVKVRGGKIETERGIAVQTAAINMRAKGSVNFGKEKIKMDLITVPVSGIRLSVSENVVNFIEFSGSLAEPSLKINGDAVMTKAISATGLGLLLAPFTGGIGLVAGAGVGFLAGNLLESWLADEHPCKTANQSGAPAEKDDPEFLNRPLDELVGEMIHF
jgi:hypothetical protein